ncbi:MAG: aminoglycoside phosphotransferase family protein [Verrucomicrobiota bacterium]
MHDLADIAGRFLVPGDFLSAEPYGNGHINDTYAVLFNQSGTEVRYVFQRINHEVFPDPGTLMENVERVCAHSQAKLREVGAADASRRSLSLIPTREGASWLVDDVNHWRCYPFIEKARTYEAVVSLNQATAAARAFGGFQEMLADLPGERLFEVIPAFHDTRDRFLKLVGAFERDACGRAASVSEEMGFVRRREGEVGWIVDAVADGRIPERITHNDTKLNNVMIDDATGEGICVIDLDTVMPGTVLNDFGDMVRTASNPEREDSRDLSGVRMRIDYFEALARGYLEGASGFLTGSEVELLPLSGKLMSLECGMRFLTDFLDGDVYFKTHREGHNLDRCRAQFKLVESIEEQMDEMKATVEGLAVSHARS